MDHHRGGDSPRRGHRHHFHPVLETVSNRQAGVPARRHDLHPAETEGRVRSVFTVSGFMSDFTVSVFESHFRSTVYSLNHIFWKCKLTVIGTTVTIIIYSIQKLIIRYIIIYYFICDFIVEYIYSRETVP